MIAALRNWLLLVLFMVGATYIWEPISISGWMNFWSRQCYFHANSVACDYGSVSTAFILSAITAFIVCMWLFVIRIKLFTWWTLLLGTAVFGFLAILSNWYVFSQMKDAGLNGIVNTNVVVQFLDGRGELVAAAIGAAVIVILQAALKHGETK